MILLNEGGSFLETTYQFKLGIAPIAWTNDDMPELGKENTFEQCISEMALAGFQGTEIGSKYPRDPHILNKALKIRGLEVAGAWFSAYLTTEDYEYTKTRFVEHCDFLKAVGADVVVVSEQGHSIQGLNKNLFRYKPTFTNEEWKILSEGMNKLGEIARKKGMDLVYHHHMGTGVQTEDEIHRLMEMTDPSIVHLLFDTGHLIFSNEDPKSILLKYFHRIKHVHLKDIRLNVLNRVKEKQMSFLEAVKEGVFTVPGDGDIDFEPIFNILKENHYKGWLLVEAEQDPKRANPFEYALIARNYLRESINV